MGVRRALPTIDAESRHGVTDGGDAFDERLQDGDPRPGWSEFEWEWSEQFTDDGEYDLQWGEHGWTCWPRSDGDPRTGVNPCGSCQWLRYHGEHDAGFGGRYGSWLQTGVR